MIHTMVQSERIGGWAGLLFLMVSVTACATLPSADTSLPAEEKEPQRIVVSFSRPPAEIMPLENRAVTDEIETLKKSPYSVTRWLAAAERFSPLMKGVLRAQGVPEELIYVAILESGFDPTVVSSVGAGGAWQFIPATAKTFGMEIDDWVDERRDYEKSTVAAAKYFSSLYSSFSSWDLALAGYNCGGGSVNAAIKACGSVSLWEMGEMGMLSSQAHGYVPRVLALILIMRDPEKYGFSRPTGVVPFTYDKVYVPGGLPLWFFAKLLGISEKSLVSLNPELVRKMTPPDATDYELKIPAGKKPLFAKKFAEAYEQYGDDIIRRGEVKKTRAK